MERIEGRRSGRWIAIAAAALAAAAGCGSNGGMGTGGTGGTGGAGTSSASTGTGGTGTGTGGAGTGGSGAGGGAGCLDGAMFADLFAIADPGFCAVAVYTADAVVGVTTWGAHHGPLSVTPDMGGKVTLTRWTAPSGATGALTKQETTVDAQIPAGAFLGGQAVDLPFFGWTAVPWTGSMAPYAGQIVMIKGGAVDATYTLDGPYAVAGVGADMNGRLLYTGESVLGATGSDQNALYAADACTSAKPDVGCAPTQAVSIWGEASGPIAVDRDGNVFAVMSAFSTGDQEARGFAAATIAHGAEATSGVKLFTLPGFGSSLAAIRPSPGATGLLVFQPFDPMTFSPLDVVAQRYTATAVIAPQGAPEKLLTVPATSTAGLSLMTDDTDRLWVVGAGDQTTTFVVIDRKN